MEVRKEERFLTNLHGRYRTGNGLAKDVVVSDLSTRGCKFYDKFCNLRPSTFVSIRIGGVGPLEAKVRWAKSNVVGLQFEQPLHDSMLDYMRTEIEDWQPADVPDASQDASKVRARPTLDAEPELPACISVRIRQPTTKDVKEAIAALQMQLPLMTEVEVVAVFHEILNRIYVASEEAE